jgi:hypothetical protein
MPNKNLFISTYSGFILCLFRCKFGNKPFIPILTVTHYKFLFISTYSGFILCLFRYKSGAKPFIPILTVTHLHQFLLVLKTQMADQLGRLLDPYPIAPLFVRFPSSDAPTPAPLPSTHHLQQVYLLVWCDSLGEASTGPIFE